ncbi:helix-turn-helix transcriptional regulator [Isoptericola aurantiacus]|uniref:helix-turn-helix transcriptional regulator n=1 Tax=Isoptericola aurantiacus TaxID=3377839 RepID=UPI00383B714A
MTTKRFLDLKQVSDELAVTKAQVYTILKNGDLPAIQVGPKRVWRIERVKLEEYIERQYAATREAVEGGDVQGEIPEDTED